MNYRYLLITCLATLGLAVGGQASDKITFVSDREGASDIWIMNADGSDPVNLTRGRECASPAWSPDGMKIAYIDSGEIWLMNADGSNPQQMTDDSVDKARLFGLKMGVAFTISPSRPGRFRTNGTALMRSLRSWMAVAPRRGLERSI